MTLKWNHNYKEMPSYGNIFVRVIVTGHKDLDFLHLWGYYEPKENKVVYLDGYPACDPKNVDAWISLIDIADEIEE